MRKEWSEKKFEKNNVKIACNVLYAEKQYPAYVSKRNSNRDKQVFLLITSNIEG